MKSSPANFKLLHDPVNSKSRNFWLHRIPVIGWFTGYWRQISLELDLVEQAVTRGQVPESEWESYDYDVAIRQAIERIVIEHAYPSGSTFHPLDPIELMMVLRYGDLNEVGIVIAIERRFGLKLSDETLDWLVKESVTFVDFIHYVEKQRTVSS